MKSAQSIKRSITKNGMHRICLRVWIHDRVYNALKNCAREKGCSVRDLAEGGLEDYLKRSGFIQRYETAESGQGTHITPGDQL